MYKAVGFVPESKVFGKKDENQSSVLGLSWRWAVPGLGLTKRTLCGIVLFKLNAFFSHVFADP